MSSKHGREKGSKVKKTILTLVSSQLGRKGKNSEPRLFGLLEVSALDRLPAHNFFLHNSANFLPAGWQVRLSCHCPRIAEVSGLRLRIQICMQRAFLTLLVFPFMSSLYSSQEIFFSFLSKNITQKDNTGRIMAVVFVERWTWKEGEREIAISTPLLREMVEKMEEPEENSK